MWNWLNVKQFVLSSLDLSEQHWASLKWLDSGPVPLAGIGPASSSSFLPWFVPTIPRKGLGPSSTWGGKSAASFRLWLCEATLGRIFPSKLLGSWTAGFSQGRVCSEPQNKIQMCARTGLSWAWGSKTLLVPSPTAMLPQSRLHLPSTLVTLSCPVLPPPLPRVPGHQTQGQPLCVFWRIWPRVLSLFVAWVFPLFTYFFSFAN